MKQRKLIKIFLILAIILVACCIKTTSYATTYIWSDNLRDSIVEKLETNKDTDKVIMLRKYLWESPYIFCREHNASFGNEREFELENKIEYPNPNAPYDDAIGNKIAYIFSQAKERNGTNYSPVQIAYWYFLDNRDTSLIDNSVTALINHAETYANYRRAISVYNNKYNIDEYKPTIIANQSKKELDNNIMKIGPYTIDYASAYYSGNSPKGFGGLTLMLTDSNGNAIPGNVAWFEDNNGTEFQGPEVTTSRMSVQNFYICVNMSNAMTGGISDIKLQVRTNVENYKVTLYNIRTDDVSVNEYQHFLHPECEESNKYVDNYHSDNNRCMQETTTTVVKVTCNGKVRNTSGATVECGYSKTYTIKEHRNDDWKTEFANHWQNNNKHAKRPQPTAQTSLVKISTYHNLGCGKKMDNGKLCGYRYWTGTMHYQKLSIIKPENNSREVTVEETINLIPPIEISLEKHNSYSAGTDRSLDATFRIEAKQDDTQILEREMKTTDGIDISIIPRSQNNIYVTITETKAPAGYRAITPITLEYHLNTETNIWSYKLSSLDGSEWKWDNKNDENSELPNTYISNNGDTIFASKDGTTFKFEIYNEPKIDLKLIKVDNNDRNLKLQGAKFSGKISGVKSLKYGGTTYTKNPEEVIDFKDLGLVTDKNGEINTTFTDLVFDGESTTIVITIEEVEKPESNKYAWYYKKLDYPITINITFTKSDGITDIKWQKNGNTEEISVVKTGEQVIEITVPNKRLIDISGKVWLDGNTGIKPVVGPDGKMDQGEEGVKGIIVELVGTSKQTKTDNDGTYSFTGIDYGPEYSIEFTYDGINYEDTTYYKDAQGNIIGDSKAQESANERTTFNNKFKTIEKGKATSSGITLEYTTTENQESKSSTSKLNTHNTTNGELNVKDFGMTATAETNDLRKDNENHTISTSNINFGLVKRGTDLALSTDLVNAEVTINDKNAEYRYNAESNSLEIGPNQTFNNKQYNLNLYSSDYNYRIRDYVSNSNFKNVDNTGDTTIETGDELKVYVRYKVNLQNQLTKTAYINEVKYTPDSRYKYNEELTTAYNTANKGITHMQTAKEGNNIIINLDGLKLEGLQTKTLYLVFEVNLKDLNGTFSNTAEITSYSTDEGLIDVDSAPGNCEGKDGIHEDDCDKSGGLTITVNENGNRTITGTVFDNTKKENVNGVIVQLIELKEFNGKYYEYIWQETTSGSDEGKRMNSDGKDIETYTTDVKEKDKGAYKFKGYIPGNYIIRFIYGDGSSYDYVHNGQDYKSVVDSKYNEEWYNKANYTQGASIARDNEARRLETMAYSVNVDAQKGVLLKLLDTTDVSKFNEVEKATLLKIVGKPSTFTNEQYTDEGINEYLTTKLAKKLLEVLNNTWMCAETSKVNVEVDGENASYANMNFGMEKRPQTKIELKKYITGFKLIASNGQTLVNATVDVKEYIENPQSISDKIQGIKDNLSVTNTYWSYEVSPTDINTIVEGATLEYVYDLVVENNSDNDYLSENLKNAYETKNISEYAKHLTDTAKTVKGEIQEGKHTYGKYLGAQYYAGGTNNNLVKTEVTQLKDYLNDNLRLVNVNVPEDKYHMGTETHNVLNDAYGLDSKEVTTIVLDGTSEKLISGGKTDMSKVTLGKDSLSASGKLDIDNYIAEVMAYTNAAGRRADTTPANAEFVSKGVDGNEARTHEKDEADTARIGIGAATGNDEKTPYVWLITIVAGIVIVAVGAVVTKKYIIK